MNTKTQQKLFFISLSILLMLFNLQSAAEADWTIVTVDSGDVGWYTSLALDNDNPRISYHEGIAADLQYTWCDADCGDTTNWDVVVVDNSGDVGRHSSLYDSSGNPHISYYEYYETAGEDDGDLKYATCSSGCDTPGNWSTETVDSTDDVGLDTSLALDGSGDPHISYFDETSLNLKYAFKSGSTWTTVTVDSLGSVGQYTSLALDGSGNPHISYHGNDALKYATCDSGCDTAGNWTVITLDSVGDAGEFTSLALDSSGNPRISYATFVTPTNGDLKYATCDSGCTTPGNWTTETVDSTGNTGWDTSLALDSGENPHIAYYKFNTGDLKYAQLNGSTWEIEDVDTAGDVGEFCSLALDSNDDPHISYYDFITSTNGDLKYALLAEPCLIDADCNDNNDCTDDTCNVPAGECVFTPNSDSCDDGQFCTATDQCSGGACVGSGDPCDPSQLCDETTDACYDDTDADGVFDNTDNCIDYPNGPLQGTCTADDGINLLVSTGQFCTVDGDCDPGEFCEKAQADNYPPGVGNGIGDACDCESDFNCDGNVDGGDVGDFLDNFGRGTFFNPCTNQDPCLGDFNCDVNVDGGDVGKFIEDFGRSIFTNQCPVCVPGDWCVYP